MENSWKTEKCTQISTYTPQLLTTVAGNLLASNIWSLSAWQMAVGVSLASYWKQWWFESLVTGLVTCYSGNSRSRHSLASEPPEYWAECLLVKYHHFGDL